MADILMLKHVTAGYNRTPVLEDLSLAIVQGQITGVIGPNGSGKTTLLNVLSGLLRPSRGTVRLDGKDITALSPDARCRLGIGRTFQMPRPFSRLKVRENVLAAAAFGSGRSRPECWDLAMDALTVTGLADKQETLSGELNLLDRKRLEIARAMSTEPELLLLDEIAAGLTGPEGAEIMDMVGTLKARGCTIIWIEHIMETLSRMADTLVCMAEGRVILTGPPAEVLASPEVERLYLGRVGEGASHAEG